MSQAVLKGGGKESECSEESDHRNIDSRRRMMQQFFDGQNRLKSVRESKNVGKL